MEKLKRVVAEEKLPEVLFQPFQPRERLSESLSVADVHLVSLDHEFEGLVYPSKVYGIRATGRPLVWLRPGMGVEELRAPGQGGVVPPRRLRTVAEQWLLLVGGDDAAPQLAAAVGVEPASQRAGGPGP